MDAAQEAWRAKKMWKKEKKGKSDKVEAKSTYYSELCSAETEMQPCYAKSSKCEWDGDDKGGECVYDEFGGKSWKDKKAIKEQIKSKYCTDQTTPEDCEE